MKIVPKILLSTLLSAFVLSACMSDDKSTTADSTDSTTTSATQEVAPPAKTEAGASAADSASATEEKAAADSTTQAESMVSRFVEGQHYRKLNFELPTEAPAGQIEVAELFWYGCPHCFHLEPTMKEYLNNKPDNVYFRRIPATLNPQWKVHARAYYIGRLLDVDGSKKIHDKIFNAIHVQRRRLQDDAAIDNFFVSQGFTEEQVKSAANSMEVQMKIKMATEYSATSQATGVPTLIVNGEYLTSPTMAQGAEKLKRVLQFLVDKSSKE